MDTRKNHHTDCEYWHDQYEWECSCGLGLRMTCGEWLAKRNEPIKKENGAPPGATLSPRL
jgi:hypothetical protein